MSGRARGRWYAAQEPRKIVSSSLGEASLTRRDARRRGLHGPEKTPKKKAREEHLPEPARSQGENN